MAEKSAVRQKSIPYGGVAKRRRRSHTASLTPKLPVGDKHDLASEPLSIAEAMERLPIPAVRVREGSSPTLTEIICRVLGNDSHGIIGEHLSVDSSLQGYQIGIEVWVSLEVGDEILGSLQESLEDSN